MDIPNTTPSELTPAHLALVHLLAAEGIREYQAQWQDRDAGLRAMARSLRRIGPETVAGVERDILWREAVQHYLNSIADDARPMPKRGEVHGAEVDDDN